ncbi:hypothetical protein [Microbacterium sp. zg.Y909]|uniref:hypothetical protein n=1 Tax=Microbacterium sp. zg.Y909 TaxID=2969413 RepID=UPI00214B7BCF|nr:hypothetical protein [Microbacterium sp. zg.Y909]MCR2824469.1 hypothetical protein [Microbacterium sp. zg.Y909]
MTTEVMPHAQQRLSLPPVAPRSSRLQWHPVTADRFEVMMRGATVGFIEIVGSVYVSLAGPRYARAVEVAQSLVWTDALVALDPGRTRGGR